MKAPIFIVGEENSGQGFLERALGSGDFAKVVTVPKDLKHRVVVAAAAQRRAERALAIEALSDFLAKLEEDVPIVNLGPLLWLAQTVASEFPHSKFVAPTRSLFAVAHDNLRSPWILAWLKDPIVAIMPMPNKFLGAMSAPSYAMYHTPTKVGLRYLSHEKEIKRLKRVLPPKRFYTEPFEGLVTNREDSWSKLEKFTGLDLTIKTTLDDLGSMYSWVQHLTAPRFEQVIVATTLPLP